MNIFDNLPVLLFAAAWVLILILWLGFKIPPRLRIPELGTSNPPPKTMPIPPDLPAPVANYINQIHGQDPGAARSVVVYGQGQFRVRRLPLIGYLWAPLAWTLHILPGEAFVWQARIYWWRNLIVDGGEEYREGQGRFSMGKKTIEGETMNRSEQVVMWLYTLLYAPVAVLEFPGLLWTTEGEHSASLKIPAGEQFLSFRLDFDAHSGRLAQIETQRPASRSGEFFPYQVKIGAYRSVGNNLTLPTRFSVAWEKDEYARYEVAGVSMNAPVDEVIAAGLG